MDWLNSFLDIISFSMKEIILLWSFLYISELIQITYSWYNYKPLSIPDSSYWNNFINELPYIIDQKNEKYFYTDPTSAWEYFDKGESDYTHNLIYKDLIFRKYLLDSGYISKYAGQILRYYHDYNEQILMYKKIHNII